MPASVLGQLKVQVQKLVKERQEHLDAVAQINEVFGQLGIMSGSAKKKKANPGRRGRPEGDATAPKRRPGRPKGSKNKVKLKRVVAVDAIKSGPEVVQAQQAPQDPDPQANGQAQEVQDIPHKRGRPKGRKPRIGRPKGSKNKTIMAEAS